MIEGVRTTRLQGAEELHSQCCWANCGWEQEIIKNNHVILLSSLSTVKKAVYRIAGNFRGVKYSLFSWAS